MDDDFGDFAAADDSGGSMPPRRLSVGVALEGLLMDMSSSWALSSEHTRDHKTTEGSGVGAKASHVYDEQEWGDFSVDENEAAAAKKRAEEEQAARLEIEQHRLEARNAPMPLDWFGDDAKAPGGGAASDLSAIRYDLTKEIDRLRTTAVSWWETYCASRWEYDSLSQLPVSLLEYLAAMHWVFFCEDVLGSLSPAKVPKALKKATLMAAHEVANQHLSPLKPLDEMDMAELLSYPKENPECQLSGVSIKVYKKFNIPVGTLDLGPVAVPFGNLYVFTEKNKNKSDMVDGGNATA